MSKYIGNRKETREKLIDKKLLLSDWDTSNNTEVAKEFYLKTSNERVDYVLLAKDGKPLAVKKKKKSFKYAELRHEQVKKYCQNIKDDNGVLPSGIRGVFTSIEIEEILQITQELVA